MPSRPPNAHEVYLQVIREGLEAVMQPELASQALFAALSPYDPKELADADTLQTMVSLHLRQELEQRVGARAAASAIEHVNELLGAVLSATSSEHERQTMEWESHSTLEIMRGVGPVQITVCATENRLADHLSNALGASRVVTSTVHDAYETRLVVEGLEPEILIFDGAHLPVDNPDALAVAVKNASPNMWVVVWCAEMPEERALRAALRDRRVETTCFDRAEGVGPLIDLIRSRSRQSLA